MFTKQGGVKNISLFIVKHRVNFFCIFLFIIVVLVFWILIGNNLGIDWRTSFRPSTINLLKGENPYTINRLKIAPWSFLLFIPLSLLPEDLGMAILTTLGISVYGFIAIKLKAKPAGVFAILLSPMVIHNLINGNIDWLVLLGFVLPPQIGLFFVSLKPQIGIALIIYWAYVAFKEESFIKTFTPFFAATLVSFLLFGFWPIQMTTVPDSYNASAWPFSIPFGLVLLVIALRNKQIRIAQAISPLLSPHVMLHSWATFLFALAPNTIELMIASISSWMLIAFAGIDYMF